MRLGFYLDEWREGGVPVFLDRLDRELTARGHEVFLFLARPFPKRQKLAQQLYVAHRRRLGRRCVPLDLGSFPGKWRGAHFREVLIRHRLDGLLLNHIVNDTSLVDALAGEIPLVTIAHNDCDYYYHEFLFLMEHRAAHIAVSRAIERKCLALTSPEDASRIHYIPYGVPRSDLFVAAPQGPLRIIYIARLDPLQKRCQDLIPLWDEYSRRGGTGELLIVGTGKGAAQLRKAFEGKYDGRVVLQPYVTDTEALALMAQRDLLLNLSNFEGLPQTALEGAMLGLEPLLSDIESGHPEIVETLQAGTLCHVGDVRSFADRLLQAEANLPALRARRPELRARALRHYNLQDCAARYEAVFAEGARSKKNGRENPAPPYRPSLKEKFKRMHLLARYRRHHR